MLNAKEDILKNVGNETVAGSHSLPQHFFPHNMEVNGYQKQFHCQHSSKYLILCSEDTGLQFTGLEQLEDA